LIGRNRVTDMPVNHRYSYTFSRKEYKCIYNFTDHSQYHAGWSFCKVRRITNYKLRTCKIFGRDLEFLFCKLLL